MYYGYDTFNKDIHHIKNQILPNQYDVVVGIPRGGLVAAVNLSHLLEIPMINSPDKDLTDVIDNLLFKGKRILIVDDIYDSGDTINDLIQSIYEKWENKIPSDRLGFAFLICNEDALNITTSRIVRPATLADTSHHFCYGTPISRKIEKRWITFFWEV